MCDTVSRFQNFWPVCHQRACFENVILLSSLQHHNPSKHLEGDSFAGWWAFHSNRDELVQQLPGIQLVLYSPAVGVIATVPFGFAICVIIRVRPEQNFLNLKGILG